MQRVCGVFGVRRRREKITAQTEEELNFPLVHSFDCLDRVGAARSGRTELELASESIKKRVAHPFPNAHRPIALNVGMTAHRTRPGSRFSNVAAEQQKIHHLLNRRDGVLVLGQSHRPATNDPLRAHRNFRRGANLFAREATRFENLFPRRRAHVRGKIFEAGRVLFDEWSTYYCVRAAFFFLKHLLHETAHRRHVAVDPDRQPQIGQRRSLVEQHLRRERERIAIFLRIRINDRDQSSLADRIDGDDRRAVFLRSFECRHHPRMVRAGILSDDKNRVGVLEVLEFHATFAYPDAFVQRRATRLVTHVRAIGQIVGAELPREELVQKRGFVAGAAARVKCGRVRRRQSIQLAREQFECFVPFHRRIMSRAFAFHHRMNEPALQLEPVIGSVAQIGDRMLAKKFRTNLFFRRLAGQRFDAVLAKLEQMSIFVRARPGAALAIEPVLLVNLEPIRDAARKSRLARRELQTFP